MTKLRTENTVRDAVRAIRSELQKLESVNHFEFTIRASGRVHDGDVMIEYQIGERYESHVKGNSIQPILMEFMRRHGWQKVNDPVAITFIEGTVEDSKQVAFDPIRDRDL